MLKKEEKVLLEQIQRIVTKQEKVLEEDHEYQLTVRKSLASQKGDIGDLNGKGYVDMERRGARMFYTDRLPETSEHRFDSINVLPRIASKYKKSDRGFDLDKMTQRDPNFMVKESFGALLSNE